MTGTPPAVEIRTFGCRLNIFESEVMRGHALAAGLDNTIVINTCAVTAEAARQARQAIRKAHRQRPGARIIVTGCAAQLEPETFAAMPGVDQVLGNEEKLTATAFRHHGDAPRNDGADVQVGDIMAVREAAAHLVDGFDGHTRAFVQIQQGCDHRCTFCIIPFARGPSRSVPLGAIVQQIRQLLSAGYREIVLTGVDIAAYGKDLPGDLNFGSAVRRLLAAVPELPRLRLSSLDAVDIDEDLIALLADEERLMPHLHLSLQAGDDMILKRMKRRHSRADAVALTARLRHLRPDIVFGADLITGFPTETQAMFENSLSLVDDCGLTYLHVFPFSPRPGTPAARMPQIDTAIRKERAKLLRSSGEAAKSAYFTACIGKHERVLVEKPGLGRTEKFALVHLDGPAATGDIVDVAITAATSDHLLGRPAV
jgi:threonylcarbamoyladenosine tRNA methylthiotransferase MtaB